MAIEDLLCRPAVELDLEGLSDWLSGKGGDVLGNAIRQNVVDNVAKLKSATPILSAAVEQNKLKVVGGILWEAAKLWTKRVPVHARPASPPNPVTIQMARGEVACS